MSPNQITHSTKPPQTWRRLRRSSMMIRCSPSSPTLPSERKSSVRSWTRYAKSLSLQPHVKNFLNILVDMKRIGVIKEILKDFEVAYNKLTQTELSIVTLVVQLESQHLTQIATMVQKLTGVMNVPQYILAGRQLQ